MQLMFHDHILYIALLIALASMGFVMKISKSKGGRSNPMSGEMMFYSPIDSYTRANCTVPISVEYGTIPL